MDEGLASVVVRVTYPRDTDLEGMARAELLDELSLFAGDTSFTKGFGRRQLINEVLAWRLERAYDLDELNSMTKRELAEWADDLGYPFRRRATKAEIIEDLLPFW